MASPPPPSQEPLVGLGLFDRPATSPASHPTSVAVNLGLRVTVPRSDRPWACRVSTPLAKPGPDGLARNVNDIERLAKVGQALVGSAANATFAAVVTANGIRTWLLYAAVAEAVEPAARAAFATQSVYVPTTEVTSDPSWSAYLALYPTPGELRDIRHRRAETTAIAAARRATHDAVAALRGTGVDLTRPAAVRYAVTIPDAAPLIARAAARGLRIELSTGAALHLVRDDLPDLALVLRTERWLIAEAARLGGKYVGWSIDAA